MIDPAYLVRFKAVSNEDLIVAALICENLTKTEVSSILDIGAGTGVVAFAISSYTKNNPKLVLVDESSKYSDLYRANDEAEFVNSRWENVQLDRSFDLVIMSHVLGDIDPIDRPTSIIKAINQLSKNGLLVSVENGPENNFDDFVSDLFKRQGDEFNINFPEIEETVMSLNCQITKKDVLTFLKIGNSLEESLENVNVLFPKIFDGKDRKIVKKMLDSRRAGHVYFIPVNQRAYFIRRN